VVPSALRTLSVVTLLSAVSGTVLALNHHGPHSGPVALVKAGARATNVRAADARFASAALIAPAGTLAPASQTEDVTYRTQLHSAALDRVQLRQQALARAAAKAAKAAARVRAEARDQARDKARAKAEEKAQAKARSSADRRLRATSVASRSSSRDPQSVARLLVADRGWSSSQFSCLVSLWNRESGWSLHAANSSSGAYGIPQALPGSKMASAGPDWRNNAATQIRWGLGYIADRYGTPCGAWGHSQATGWY
jgi:hypothetical protein